MYIERCPINECTVAQKETLHRSRHIFGPPPPKTFERPYSHAQRNPSKLAPFAFRKQRMRVKKSARNLRVADRKEKSKPKLLLSAAVLGAPSLMWKTSKLQGIAWNPSRGFTAAHFLAVCHLPSQKATKDVQTSRSVTSHQMKRISLTQWVWAICWPVLNLATWTRPKQPSRGNRAQTLSGRIRYGDSCLSLRRSTYTWHPVTKERFQEGLKQALWERLERDSMDQIHRR